MPAAAQATALAASFQHARGGLRTDRRSTRAVTCAALTTTVTATPSPANGTINAVSVRPRHHLWTMRFPPICCGWRRRIGDRRHQCRSAGTDTPCGPQRHFASVTVRVTAQQLGLGVLHSQPDPCRAARMGGLQVWCPVSSAASSRHCDRLCREACPGRRDGGLRTNLILTDPAALVDASYTAFADPFLQPVWSSLLCQPPLAADLSALDEGVSIWTG